MNLQEHSLQRDQHGFWHAKFEAVPNGTMEKKLIQCFTNEPHTTTQDVALNLIQLPVSSWSQAGTGGWHPFALACYFKFADAVVFMLTRYHRSTLRPMYARQGHRCINVIGPCFGCSGFGCPVVDDELTVHAPSLVTLSSTFGITPAMALMLPLPDGKNNPGVILSILDFLMAEDPRIVNSSSSRRSEQSPHQLYDTPLSLAIKHQADAVVLGVFARGGRLHPDFVPNTHFKTRVSRLQGKKI